MPEMTLDDMVVKVEEGVKRVEATVIIGEKAYVVKCLSAGTIIRMDLIPASNPLCQTGQGRY